MIDPGLAAVIAALVSLALGAASIFRSSADSRGAARREQTQRRADAYVDVLRIVETRGIAVQDQMYNYTETEDVDYEIQMPRRQIDKIPRSDRAEARALLAAYGTPQIRLRFEEWLAIVDAWSQKTDSWQYEAQLNGPPDLVPKDAEPERTNELASRRMLGDAISASLK